MQSRTRKEEKSDRNDGEGGATKNDKGKKKAVSKLERAPLHYTQEVGNAMSSNFSRKPHHVKLCEEYLHFYRKRSSFGHVLSHMNYEGHGKVSTRPLW